MKERTLSSEEGQKKGCFFTASVVDIELKWRFLRSASPVLAIHKKKKKPRIANKGKEQSFLSHQIHKHTNPPKKKSKLSLNQQTLNDLSLTDNNSIAQLPRIRLNPNFAGFLIQSQTLIRSYR